MNEIRRLENQIRELQRELQRQNYEAARMRQSLADENLRNLRAYQEQMRNNLNQHDKSVQKEYERLLREYQRSTEVQIQEQQLEMDIEYQKLVAGMKQKEQEWVEKSRQLENLIIELKKNTQEKDNASAQEANQYMTRAALTYKDIEKKPHEKFCPKRITAFYNAIREARTLFKSGLNEAAIAIAISAKSGLIRLGYEIDDEYEEWKRQYFIFKNKVGMIHLNLSDEIKSWMEISTGKKESNITDEKKRKLQFGIDFWSKGEYAMIYHRISKFGREIAKIEKNGFDQYLKEESSYSIDDLKKYINELDELNKKMEIMCQLYVSRYYSSCERADWGEKIIDYFVDEINLTWMEDETHFKAVDPDDKERRDYVEYMQSNHGAGYNLVDMREWLEIVFKNSMETRIFIYIVPYEKNVSVENRMVVYVDYIGAENEDYSRQIYEHIKECIQLETDDGTIHFATDVSQLTTNMNTVLRETGNSLEEKIKNKQ